MRVTVSVQSIGVLLSVYGICACGVCVCVRVCVCVCVWCARVSTHSISTFVSLTDYHVI